VNCTYCGHETAAGECPICGASHVRDAETFDVVMLGLPLYHVEGGHRLGVFAPRDYLSDATTAIRFGVEPSRYCMACNRVVIGGEWEEDDPPADRPVSHGICPECEDAWIAEVEETK
jgi:hypothetical protein